MERKPSNFILAACLVLIAATAACNPISSAPPPAEEKRGNAPHNSTPLASTVPATDTRPVIVTFGDSLTAGVAGRSYPDDLQDLLDGHGYTYRVDNQGVSGDTSTDGLARIDNVLAAHPALVILEFGGNDGLRGVPVDSTRQNLQQMITQLMAAKIQLVLLGITLPPNYGVDYVRSFTAMYPDLARKYRLRFVPFLLLNVYKHPELMQGDGIHPSGEGNKVVAGDVFTLIRPIIKQSGGK